MVYYNMYGSVTDFMLVVIGLVIVLELLILIFLDF